MKNKKSILIFVLTLFVFLPLMPRDVFSYKESDLKNFKSTYLCPRCDLTNADLREANLSGAYLEGAKLDYANLTEAILTGADLTGADLTGAYLIGVDLTGADLTGADLTGADLTSANLSDAKLKGANLNETTLTGVKNPELELIWKMKQDRKKKEQALENKIKSKKEEKIKDILVLELVYLNYIFSKRCIEIPKGYKNRYIGNTEFNSIKKSTKLFDNYIKSKYLDLDTDKVWLKANIMWNKSWTKTALKMFDDVLKNSHEQTCDEAIIFFKALTTGTTKGLNFSTQFPIYQELDYDYKHLYSQMLK